MFVITIVLAIVSALFSATLLPALAIFSGIVNLNLIIILIYLFFGKTRQAAFFLVFSSIALSIFSTVDLIYLIVPAFIIISAYLFLANKRIILKPGVILSLPIFFLSTMVFDTIILLLTLQFSFPLLAKMLVDSLITTLIGSAFYYLIRRIYIFLNPQIFSERIKISHFNMFNYHR